MNEQTLLDLANYYKNKANEFEEKFVIAQSQANSYRLQVQTLTTEKENEGGKIKDLES